MSRTTCGIGHSVAGPYYVGRVRGILAVIFTDLHAIKTKLNRTACIILCLTEKFCEHSKNKNLDTFSRHARTQTQNYVMQFDARYRY